MIRFRGVAQDNAAYHEGISDQLAGRPKLTAQQYASSHPTADADDYPLYEAGYAADRSDLKLGLTPTRGAPRMRRLELTSKGLTDRETDANGLVPTDDLDSLQVRKMKTADKVADKDGVQPKDNGGTEDGIATHKFQGGNLLKCKKCGKGINAVVHKPSWPPSKRAEELDDLRSMAADEGAALDELETRGSVNPMTPDLPEVDDDMGGKPGQPDKPIGDVAMAKKKHLFHGGDIKSCALSGCGKPITDSIHGIDPTDN